MINRLLRLRPFCIIALLPFVFPVAPVAAQSSAFSYQGKLSDSGNPANGNYDFTFSLWDAASGGAAVGENNLILGVTVANGSFTVTLNFGTAAFPGADRYLEIAVRPANIGSYTTLTPRQQILPTPYSIKATIADGLSVTCVNCITSSQIQSVNGNAVTGAIPVASVPAGSDNYIQNGTAQQPTSNFNLSGTGTAHILNAATQYNLNGLRAFTVNGAYNNGVEIFTASNTFTGDGAGLNTTPDASPTGSNGKFNSFYGAGAGQANTTGNSNAAFGSRAGFANTTGFSNAFFGASAGRANTSGSGNAFFGVAAGFSNTTGGSNAFLGLSAGNANTTGNLNAFFGAFAGQANTTADSNAFFGALAGQANISGSGNAFFGSYTGNANTTGTFNAFFGSRAGNANTTGELNTFFGFQSGYGNITGSGNGFFGLSAGFSNTTGSNNTMIGIAADVGSGNLTNATSIGARAVVTQSNALVLGAINGVNGCGPVNNCDSVNVGIGTTAPTERLHVTGNVYVTGIVIQNSDVRLKQHIRPLGYGLSEVLRLRPVSWHWRDHPERGPQLGLLAQQVEAVLPELVSTAKDVEHTKGVNYTGLLPVLVNAIQEHQQQLERQQEHITQQKRQLERYRTQLAQQQARDLEQEQEMATLRHLLCRQFPKATVCRLSQRLKD